MQALSLTAVLRRQDQHVATALRRAVAAWAAAAHVHHHTEARQTHALARLCAVVGSQSHRTLPRSWRLLVFNSRAVNLHHLNRQTSATRLARQAERWRNGRLHRAWLVLRHHTRWWARAADHHQVIHRGGSFLLAASARWVGGGWWVGGWLCVWVGGCVSGCGRGYAWT